MQLRIVSLFLGRESFFFSLRAALAPFRLDVTTRWSDLVERSHRPGKYCTIQAPAELLMLGQRNGKDVPVESSTFSSSQRWSSALRERRLQAGW